jgi:hypothetical protein
VLNQKCEIRHFIILVVRVLATEILDKNQLYMYTCTEDNKSSHKLVELTDYLPI